MPADRAKSLAFWVEFENSTNPRFLGLQGLPWVDYLDVQMAKPLADLALDERKRQYPDKLNRFFALLTSQFQVNSKVVTLIEEAEGVQREIFKKHFGDDWDAAGFALMHFAIGLKDDKMRFHDMTVGAFTTSVVKQYCIWVAFARYAGVNFPANRLFWDQLCPLLAASMDLRLQMSSGGLATSNGPALEKQWAKILGDWRQKDAVCLLEIDMLKTYQT